MGGRGWYLLPTFRDEVSIPSSRVQRSGIVLGLLGPRRWDQSCPEASAINYLPTWLSNTEGGRPQKHCGASLKFAVISSGLEKEFWATSRRVEGSVHDGVTGIFHWHKPVGRTVTLGSNQVLTEFSNRNISWGPIIMKSGSLNLLELSRPVQARTVIALTGDSKTAGRGAPWYISKYCLFVCFFLIYVHYSSKRLLCSYDK